MTRQCAVADALCRYGGKGGLQSREELCAQHTVNFTATVHIGYVATDIFVKQEGVCNPIRELPVAADGNVHIQANVPVYHPEGDGIGGTVFVAHNFFGVEVVDSLVHGGVSAEAESLAQSSKGAQ